MAERADAIEAERGTIRLPERAVQPLRQIGRRLLYALGQVLELQAGDRLVLVTSP